MRRFRHWPIKRKLTLVIMVTSGAALLLASVAIVTYDQITFRPATVQRLSTLAEIIAANCTAAISFQDAGDAQLTLKSLRARPDIAGGCIYNREGTVFALYAQTKRDEAFLPAKAESEGYRFEGGYLILSRPIVHKGERLGSICLRMDLQEQRDRLRAISIIVLLFVAGSLVVAYLLSSILQRVVSQPVLDLADVAQRVTTARDYSLRATKRNEDETGLLTDAFNQMLTQIQERDSALLHARDDLEERVQQRTSELAHVNEGLQTEIRERERSQRRTALQYAITRVLAESPTLTAAAPRIVEAVCAHTGWDVGAVWNVDLQANVLRCVDVWHPPMVSVTAFEAKTRASTFVPGVGLPGRVWADHRPVWIPDVVKDSNFPRAQIAAKDGLHGAFGFPVVLGGEVLAVMEFFSREVRPLDTDLLQMFAVIGSQIGQFIERKRAEGALREAEAKYRRLVEQLPAITYMAEFGPAGRWLYVSPQIETLLGFKAQEWMADPELSARQIHPEDRKLMRAEETRSRTSGDVLRTEYRMRARDGRVVWFRDEAIVVKDVAGQPLFMQGLMFDITERKQADEALREAEAKYRTLVEQLPAITYIAEFGSAGRWTYVSPQIERILGFAPNEWMDRAELWIDQIHPDDRQRVLTEESDSRATGEPVRCEYRMRARDGRVVWFRDEAAIIKDQAGKPLYLHGLMFDITERKQADELVRESEKRFRDLFESSPDAIFVEDLNGNVLDVNPAACRLHAIDRTKLLGMHASELVAPEMRQKVEQRAPKIASGELNNIESVNLAADGRVFPVSITISRVDYQGQPAVLLHVRDITARKKAEAEAEQKRKELVRSNKELEHFAYIASHDLQEPLRMVASYTQLLAKRYQGKLDKDADEFIHYAVDGARRMQQLINDLLTYARITTRGKPFQPTDCSAMLQRVMDNLKIAIEEGRAEVTHDPLPTVVADPTQLSQVFQNLIGNAIKFRDKKPPRVHVGAQRKDDAWLFSVRDEGIGIPTEHIDRIFLIFQRLHTREEYPGTGIGLAVCRRIVERHGGNIWVESEPGKGSTFYFTIPDKGANPS